MNDNNHAHDNDSNNNYTNNGHNNHNTDKHDNNNNNNGHTNVYPKRSFFTQKYKPTMRQSTISAGIAIYR